LGNKAALPRRASSAQASNATDNDGITVTNPDELGLLPFALLIGRRAGCVFCPG
jgi:hypothetical protein